ncbi:hypothetical protein ABU614_09080 [Lysobacter firmicutimachus]|uniref:Uncharacterized protein n=1 Tax=Lysobacter firmicutimachus TaxID=1792846 RepID=A0AAU8MX45_9GAMM|nr:hypothetical protein [Lysobacter antibioticus]
MKVSGFNVDPRRRYDGPEFMEYCISEKAYLPADRDRTPCITCPLGQLCEAGFHEQVRLVTSGQNPSLTECKVFPDEALSRDGLLSGLSSEQRAFVLRHVFDVEEESRNE